VRLGFRSDGSAGRPARTRPERTEDVDAGGVLDLLGEGDDRRRELGDEAATAAVAG
jgi:hypothetical protein